MPEERILRRSAINRLKASYRSSSPLLGPLTRHVMRKSDGQYRDAAGFIHGADRRNDVMHPSDMSKSDWCPRFDYYRIINAHFQNVPRANPSMTMANILTEGTNIHVKYQTWFWEMGVLYGWWKCEDCERYWEALSPTKCDDCEGTRLTYKEVPLLDKRMMIGGHADGAIHGLLVEDVLIEVKSIGIRTLAFDAPRLYEQYLKGASADDIWFQINRPFGSHLKQGMTYLWLAEGRYRIIHFIYESKFNQQVKEFKVKLNPMLINPLLEDARDVAQGVRAKIPPDHPSWGAPEGPICKSCGYRSICWGLKEHNDTEHQTEEPLQVVRTIGRRRKAVLAKARERTT